jgi:hypothetical protein
MGWLTNRLPTGSGLAYERGACSSDLSVVWLKRGVKRCPICNQTCPSRFPIPLQWKELVMAAVMIGIDPHKASHTAVAIDAAEVALGRLRIRASAGQVEALLAFAAPWPQRSWAIEGAGGLGYLLAQPRRVVPSS